jgi:hypothetical protein
MIRTSSVTRHALTDPGSGCNDSLGNKATCIRQVTTLLKPLPIRSQGCPSTLAYAPAIGRCTYLSILDLIKRGHDIQSHQLRSLGNDGISAHCSNCRNLSVLSLVRSKLFHQLCFCAYRKRKTHLELRGVAIGVDIVETCSGSDVS